MFRKRRSDRLPEPTRRAFAVAAGLVNEAQRALIAAVPTSRNSGVPLSNALVAFIAALGALDEAMAAWRDERVAHEWTKCAEGIREARSQAIALQSIDVELTFEQLNTRVGDVLYPLEAFADAERDLRRR
jgi:putative heme degradation protein